MRFNALQIRIAHIKSKKDETLSLRIFSDLISHSKIIIYTIEQIELSILRMRCNGYGTCVDGNKFANISYDTVFFVLITSVIKLKQISFYIRWSLLCFCNCSAFGSSTDGIEATLDRLK